jgi:hypothetical protein
MSFDQAFTSILCPYDEPFIVETDLNKIVSIFTKLFYSYDMFIVPFSNVCNFEGTIEYLNLLNNLQLKDAKKITFPSLFDVKGIFNDVYVYSIRDVYLHLINEYPSFSLFYSQINQAPRQTVVLFTEKLMASYEQFNTFCQNYLQIFFAFSHNEYLYTQTRNSKIFAHTSYRSIRTDERGTLLINNQNEIIATFKLSSSEYLQINHESGKTIRLTNIERFLLEEKNN